MITGMEKMIMNRLNKKKKKLMRESLTTTGTTSSARSSISNNRSKEASSSSSFFKCFSSSSSSSDHHHLSTTDDESTTAGVRRANKAGHGRGRGGGGEKVEIFENVQAFTSKQMDVATDHFQPSNRIGEGGFGSVYKGRLEDGRAVAIKVLSAESRQGDREFMSELATLSHITHDNLVHLIGGCVDGPRRMLIYEYMDNGNLAQNLLDKSALLSSWEARKGIALGIAAGLAHLHEEVRPRHIVHRDIKATNILLDLDLRPKISDFGLSKFFPDDITHITTRVAGTLGYLAPEYAISGHLTRKLDVYSFGALLLEIVSGKTAVDFDQTLGEQYFLVERAWQLYKSEQLLQLVDPIMKGDENSFLEAERFLRVALLCLQQKSRLRPTMSAALKMMNETTMWDEDGGIVEITEPGLISDFMAVKIGRRKQDRDRWDGPQSSTATATGAGGSILQ